MNNLGCSFLESGINFDFNKVTDCCISHNDGRGLPILIENYKGEVIDWEKLFETKSKRMEAQKNETIYDCLGCYRLSNYDLKEVKKISDFHFSHCHACNSKCIYCSPDTYAGPVNYDVYPIIKDLIEKGYYKAGGEATFQGGEPTMMQNFDEVAELLVDNGTKIRVHTSAIKYSPTVEKALRTNSGSVVISLDSSSSRTYKTVKQVDAFDLVIENIKKYVEAAKENKENLIIKYIIIPGINDSVAEIDSFLNLMKSFGITTVVLDIEVQYARKHDNKNVSNHIYLLADYFYFLAKKLNINVLTYSFISYVLNNRQIKPSKLINNKFLYNILIKFNTDKTKNLSYKRV